MTVLLPRSVEGKLLTVADGLNLGVGKFNEGNNLGTTNREAGRKRLCSRGHGRSVQLQGAEPNTERLERVFGFW